MFFYHQDKKKEVIFVTFKILHCDLPECHRLVVEAAVNHLLQTLIKFWTQLRFIGSSPMTC